MSSKKIYGPRLTVIPFACWHQAANDDHYYPGKVQA